MSTNKSINSQNNGIESSLGKEVKNLKLPVNSGNHDTNTTDEDHLNLLLRRVITPAYPGRPKGEIQFNIPHKRLVTTSGFNHCSPASQPCCMDAVLPEYNLQRIKLDTTASSEKGNDSYTAADLDDIIESLRCTKDFKFVYLTPISSPSELVHPYTLKVAPFEEIDKNYYLTISPSGVIIHDGSQQHYTTLDQWQHDFHIFQLISKIPTLKLYRLWKSFLLWKKHIASRKQSSAREMLLQNLFLLDPVFNAALLEVVAQCLLLENSSFSDLSITENFELNDFFNLQIKRSSVVVNDLNEFHNYVIKLLMTACQMKFKIFNVGKKGATSRTAHTHPRTYLDKCNAKLICSKLCRLIHLVAFHVSGLYRKTIRNSYQALHDCLLCHLEFMPSLESTAVSASGFIDVPRKSYSPQMPFFHIRLIADPAGLLLRPSDTEFCQVFTEVLNIWVASVLKLPEVVNDPHLASITSSLFNGKHIEGLFGVGPCLPFAIESDSEIQTLKAQIIKNLKKNFEVLNVYLKRFQSIHEFYVNNLKSSLEHVTQASDPSFFRNLLEKFHAQIYAIQAIVEKQPLGLLLLHVEEFKKDVLPCTSRMLQAIEHSIPPLGSTKIQLLMKECTKAVEYLENEPKTTLDFVGYLRFIETLRNRLILIDDDVRYVDDIYQIVKEFKVPCPMEDLEAHSTFKNLLDVLNNLWAAKVEEKEDMVAKLSLVIEKDIAELNEQIMGIQLDMKQKWLVGHGSNPEECTTTLHVLSERLATYQAQAVELCRYQQEFQLEVSRFFLIEEALAELKVRQLLWETFEVWISKTKEFRFGDFNAIQPDKVTQFIAEILKSVSQIEKVLPQNDITLKLKDEIKYFQIRIPVILHLRNSTLKPRHWLSIESMLGRRFLPGEPFNFDTLEACGVLGYVEELENLATQASSEAALEDLLKKVELAWEDMQLMVLHHGDTQDSLILGGVDEIIQTLDESFFHINAILSSRHVGPIKSRVQAWHKSLNLFSKTIDEWCDCQNNWLYLESIFSTPNIQQQLPAEARLFSIVNRTWHTIMHHTKENPLAIVTGTLPGTLEALENNNHLMDQILRCLEAYLESRRVVFPRFYFLSNKELLEILAQTRNPHAVTPHLTKCFHGIKSLEFTPVQKAWRSAPDIIAMTSPEGERVPFIKAVKASRNVEDWLVKVENQMITSLRKALKNALDTYEPTSRFTWVINNPAQIVLTASQIMRCTRIQRILEESNNSLVELQNFEEESAENLKLLTEWFVGELSVGRRTSLCALIIQDIHGVDSIRQLVSHQISSSNDFEWVKCLRYYWNASIEDCVVRMSTSCSIYGHEYLGASSRLVVTPLTGKCFLCLMGALHLNLGGALTGPAGTGKTATVKDLAKALAVLCIVFNCSESLDFKMMRSLFSGLSQAGAWCCLDDFNRIEIEVLSVISQHLLTIRNAKLACLKRFMFEGQEIALNSGCAVFITMNPSYANRADLPENLKALFRPMAMMIPDYSLIAEIILYSEGFNSSKILAQKLTHMFKLCSEQFSQQNHYDFGMRALQSVLSMAGKLKQTTTGVPDEVILIIALRKNNLPKLLPDDVSLFEGIISDLFPGAYLPPEDYGQLEKTIHSVLLTSNMQPMSCIVRKAIQLHETMAVRHGVMLVGSTGGGKTTVLKTLQQTLIHLHGKVHLGHLPVQIYIINPKAITTGELYGEVHPSTLKWADGVLGLTVRNASQCEAGLSHWIVCDGPVDPVWIENLNTVLDDNKTLCLANSERIKLTPAMHMIFEVHDLENASPATVSRCGVVHVDASELGWLPYVKSWLLHILQAPAVREQDKLYLLELFEIHVTECLKFVNQKCGKNFCETSIGKVMTLCCALQAMLQQHTCENDDNPVPKAIFGNYFVFALFWAIGGDVDEQERSHFLSFLRTRFEADPNVRLPLDCDIGDLYVDTYGTFQPWRRLFPEFSYESTLVLSDTLVPTVDTVRSAFLMKLLISTHRGVLITGEPGQGKSVVTKSVWKTLRKTQSYIPVSLSFSARTSSFKAQEMLEAHLEKKRKALLGAPMGKKVVVLVDDVNMPSPDPYGSQPPIELIRQFIDSSGLYDREKLFWKRVEDVTVCATCGPLGGDRHPLPPRFLRHFSVLTIPAACDQTLLSILQVIIEGFLSDFVAPVKELGGNLTLCIIALYRHVQKKFRPTPSSSHYIFNLHNIFRCIQGVLQATPTIYRDNVSILRLFYHECLRCFQDCLNCQEHKKSFSLIMKKEYLNLQLTFFYFHASLELSGSLAFQLCMEHFGTPVEQVDEGNDAPLVLFGDFMKTTGAGGQRVYEILPEIEEIQRTLQDWLNDYNLTRRENMNLVLFGDAVEHCCRVARILRMQGGHGLLIGVAGIGKQSLSRLAAHLNGHRFIQIKLTHNYDHVHFQADLRSLFWRAAMDLAPVTFLLADGQIVREEFLEDLNSLLNSGEVPNLFEGDEFEKVIQAMHTSIKDTNLAVLKKFEIFQFFLSRAKTFLHLIITMSPIGDDFRRRCRMFPSLINCCTIDWFMSWPTEALLSVAKHSLKGTVNEALGVRLYPVCVTMHKSVETFTERLLVEKRRFFYCPPSIYLNFLKLFNELLNRKSDEMMGLKDRFSNGLQKLYETRLIVETMKAELVAYEPLLADKSEAAALLMKHLAKQQANADHVRQVVVADEAVAKCKATETQMLADDAQRDFAEAVPAMEVALKSLDALNKNDIGELRNFNKPPNLVKMVLDAICLLFDVKQDWPSAKVLLSDVNFLKRLREFDKDRMSETMLKVLRTRYIEHPDFVPDKVATQSKVCRSLCMWIRALDVHARVFKAVEPKRKALDVAKIELNDIMSVLREKKKRLAEVEAQIAGLEAELDSAVAEKAAVEAAMSLTAARLGRSSRLTTALSDEQARWEGQVKVYSQRLVNVVGDALLSAGCLAYFGIFPKDFREELIQDWLAACFKHEVPVSSDFSMVSALTDPYEIRSWISLGLPQDTISIENAILVTHKGRFPLIIDPQGGGNRWIRSLEQESGLLILHAAGRRSLKILADAVRAGRPVLIEDIGEAIDPILYSLLLNQTFIEGGQLRIRLGDSDIEYDKHFRLYLTSRLPNPRFSPEICIMVTLVNFIVSISGIEQQLLAEIVQQERSDLENSRNELVLRINSDKLQIKNIEEKILKMLFRATGNILDDEELIDTLNESRENSEMIAARLEEEESTEIRMRAIRELYRPLATRGALLYSVVSQLSLVDPMYQFSLTYLFQFFCSIILHCEEIIDVEVKVKLLQKRLTLATFTNVSYGLFERHKLMLAFIVCVSIGLHEGTIAHDSWTYFLKNDIPDTDPNPYTDISNKAWSYLKQLSKIFPQFKGLAENLNQMRFSIGKLEFDFTATLAKTASNASVHNVADWNKRLTDFEKLLVIKALREDKLVSGITEYVKSSLGVEFVKSSVANVYNIFQGTSNLMPLIFILSSGSDPFSTVQKLAVKQDCIKKLCSVSLGQGQGPIAEKMIALAAIKGDWVFLQNCHLAFSWMAELEQKYLNLVENSEKVHPDFRLLLSSKPFSGFPAVILQNSLKINMDPPRELNSNIIRSLSEISEDFFEDSPLQESWRRMVFGLCYFHSYVQERNSFGPLGWNVPYAFNGSDRDVALNNLKMFCTDMNIPWKALQYITCEITYGGKVTDPWDLRCLRTILEKLFSHEALKPGYKFCPSGVYFCPESPDCCTLAAYIDFTQQLPFTECAQDFWLSGNASSTYKRNQATNLMSQLLKMYAKESEVTKTDDAAVLELVDMTHERLIQFCCIKDECITVKQTEAENPIPPLLAVLLKEVTRYDNLLQVVMGSLRDMKKVVNGEILMTEQLGKVYVEFNNRQVPAIWSRVSYMSLKCLSSWVCDLELRLRFIQTWLKSGLPTPFWLSGLFCPEGFLTAVLQTSARTKGIPIDQVTFDFKVQQTSILQSEMWSNNAQLPSHGVFVNGLYLEGAGWDLSSGKLVDPVPYYEPALFPILFLEPTTEKPSTYKRYECPVYKTAKRAGSLSSTGTSTNFVLAVLLPSDEDSSHWVLMGTALLMQVSD